MAGLNNVINLIFTSPKLRNVAQNEELFVYSTNLMPPSEVYGYFFSMLGTQ